MADERGPREHLDPATVADFDAGLLDQRQTESASAHLLSCARCQQVRADLAELPALLASSPSPGMPADVAARLDAAVERAAQERTRNEHVAPVVSLLERGRQWFAPLAAAAAVAAAIFFVAPSLDLGSSGDDAASSTDDGFAEGGTIDAPEGAGPSPDRGGRRLELSSESFARDVAKQLYGGGRPRPTAAFNPEQREALDARVDRFPCTSSGRHKGARLKLVLLDGQPASLLLYGPPSKRVAVAVSCDNGRPVVEAQGLLDLR